MAAHGTGTVALGTGTGSTGFTANHGIVGLNANPPANTWAVDLLYPSTVAAGISVLGIGSTTIQFSKSATDAGTAHFHARTGVRVNA